MRIADVHAHIFPDKLAEKAALSIGAFYGTDMYEPASIANLLQAHADAGIERALVSNSAVTPEQVHNINNFLADACREHPQWLGFGSIYPGMDGAEEELERVKALGLRGLKIHSDFQKLAIDDPSAIDTYRIAAKLDLTVLFHMGDNRYDYSSVPRLENLLRQVPDLRVIASHFGGWQVWQQVLAHPLPENVIYDTSSSTPFISREFALRLIDRYGVDRCLFGSDFPMWSPKEEIARVQALGLSQSEQEQIFYGNFARFFNLK